MKRVYVVTSGEYSDYQIEKIFSDRVKAHMYSLLDPDRRVEEYDVDDVELDIAMDYLLVSYDYQYNHIDGLTLCGDQVNPNISDRWTTSFEFTLMLSDDRVYRNVMRYGKDSKVILKIAQDDTSREEIIRKRDERYNNPNVRTPIAFYTTSSVIDDWTPSKISLEVNQYVANVLKQRIVEGKPLPPVEELQTIYYTTAKEVEKEHEQD